MNQKKSENARYTGLRLYPETYDKIIKICQIEDRSINYVINRAIKLYLDSYDFKRN